MHVNLEGHKSQNYSFIINCILFSTLFSSRSKDLLPLKTHMKNLACSNDLVKWALECWVEESSSAYCLGLLRIPSALGKSLLFFGLFFM